MLRVDLQLEDKSEWVKVFDPRDCTLFVPLDEPPELNSTVRVDLVLGDSGPRVLLRGKVMRRQAKANATSPAGCVIALGPKEQEKINYLNGYVRGGMLDLREKRRLPVRLPVTYGGIDGPCRSFTRDINEEGVFVISEDPLPEESRIHMLITVPGRDEPLSLHGEVSHTVLADDEDIPGMGVVFEQQDRSDELTGIIDRLEKAFLSGTLPESTLL
ncbi:PilZ domain-containing protein [Haliangium ochraceum]|uniref:Type IV pilus assembly PilZ n=1 Tax=Haliangium ochraceum (strain DSM 14365 / JCM 11303 / SMP-2) TaxID=502025 RepID=D0LK95_HALO1|nr:PilZ domain-containing protein [Haliangium ochraceum]ACY13129.1 type IV pilus assembly PilZ [Haliangium ochraceum DSM 14365]